MLILILCLLALLSCFYGAWSLVGSHERLSVVLLIIAILCGALGIFHIYSDMTTGL